MARHIRNISGVVVSNKKKSERIFFFTLIGLNEKVVFYNFVCTLYKNIVVLSWHSDIDVIVIWNETIIFNGAQKGSVN